MGVNLEGFMRTLDIRIFPTVTAISKHTVSHELQPHRKVLPWNQPNTGKSREARDEEIEFYRHCLTLGSNYSWAPNPLKVILALKMYILGFNVSYQKSLDSIIHS